MRNELELQTLAERILALDDRQRRLGFPSHEARRLKREPDERMNDLIGDFSTYLMGISAHSRQVLTIPTWSLEELQKWLEFHRVDVYERYERLRPFRTRVTFYNTPELFNLYQHHEDMKRLLIEYLQALIELKQNGQEEVIDRFLANTETERNRRKHYGRFLSHLSQQESDYWQSLPAFEEPVDPPYAIRYPEHFDQERENQMCARGYTDEVSVVFEDGREYDLFFCDVSILRAEMPFTTTKRTGWWAKPNVIFVNFVTAEDIRQAVERAYQEGYFEKLGPKR